MVASQECMLSLRAKWDEQSEAVNEMGIARARAKKLAAELEVLLFTEMQRLRVPEGYSIDYLGDGKVKPVAECLKIPGG